MNKFEIQQIEDFINMLNYIIENNEKLTINKKLATLILKYINYLESEVN